MCAKLQNIRLEIMLNPFEMTRPISEHWTALERGNDDTYRRMPVLLYFTRYHFPEGGNCSFQNPIQDLMRKWNNFFLEKYNLCTSFNFFFWQGRGDSFRNSTKNAKCVLTAQCHNYGREGIYQDFRCSRKCKFFCCWTHFIKFKLIQGVTQMLAHFLRTSHKARAIQ